MGWERSGVLPSEKKYVLIVAPHTSNWDYVVGQLYCFASGVRPSILVKKELFWFPLGNLLRALGGIPVDRHRKTDIVDDMIKHFHEQDNFVLTIAPEGTRKRVSEWKTGFHRIASGAGVPVLRGFLDYRRKIIGVGDFITLSDDPDSDLKRVKEYYRKFSPKYPENFTTGPD